MNPVDPVPADTLIGRLQMFDTETTGVHQGASLVQWAGGGVFELAAVTAATVTDLASSARFDVARHGRRPFMRAVAAGIAAASGARSAVMLCDPSDSMALAARNTHMLPEGPTSPTGDELVSRDVGLAGLRDWVSAYPWYTGYSIEYDAAQLATALPGARIVAPAFDVMRLARCALFSLTESGDLWNTKLDTVFAVLFPDRLALLHELRCIHDALIDAWLTTKILVALLSRVGINPLRGTVAEVLAVLARPLPYTKWPFGKLQGQPLRSDPSYARWFMTHSGQAASDMRATYPDVLGALRAIF